MTASCVGCGVPVNAQDTLCWVCTNKAMVQAIEDAKRLTNERKS